MDPSARPRWCEAEPYGAKLQLALTSIDGTIRSPATLTHALWEPGTRLSGLSRSNLSVLSGWDALSRQLKALVTISRGKPTGLTSRLPFTASLKRRRQERQAKEHKKPAKNIFMII